MGTNDLVAANDLNLQLLPTLLLKNVTNNAVTVILANGGVELAPSQSPFANLSKIPTITIRPTRNFYDSFRYC